MRGDRPFNPARIHSEAQLAREKRALKRASMGLPERPGFTGDYRPETPKDTRREFYEKVAARRFEANTTKKGRGAGLELAYGVEMARRYPTRMDIPREQMTEEETAVLDQIAADEQAAIQAAEEERQIDEISLSTPVEQQPEQRPTFDETYEGMSRYSR